MKMTLIPAVAGLSGLPEMTGMTETRCIPGKICVTNGWEDLDDRDD